MRFSKIYFLPLWLVSFLYCAKVTAQQKDSTFTDIDYVVKSNAWLYSKNAAGLNYISLPAISSAQLFLNRANGDFRNYHQSPDSYNFGLQSQSYSRLNKNLVFSGSVLYNSFTGENMAGSGFIDPYQTPFDIVESNDKNRGTKKQEAYTLTGKVAAKLSNKFILGGSIVYEASNFAKLKDLRHINKLLYIDASLGALLELGNTAVIGLNYNYLRRMESIGFRSFGNKGEGFESLISFGAFYGRRETFDREGFTSSENTWPLSDIGHASSLQLELHFGDGVKLLNELSYVSRDGFYGIKRTSSKPFTNHQRADFGYLGTLSVIDGKNEHYLSLKAEYGTLINHENTVRTQTPPGGVENITIYVTNEVLDRQQLKANLAYTMYKDMKKYHANWVFDANFDFFRRQQTIAMYPFYRDQTVNSYQLNTKLNRNIVKNRHIYSAAFGLGYGVGSGLAKYDGLYADPSASVAPSTMDLYLYQEFEYFTKPRATVNLSLQYTNKMNAFVAPYIKLNYGYTRAFKTEFLGKYFSVASISIGGSF